LNSQAAKDVVCIMLFELYHTRMDFNMVEAGGIEHNITFTVIYWKYTHT